MLKESSLGVSAQVTAVATSLFSLPVYAKYLGAEQFSLVLLFSTIQAWLSLVDGGFSTALTQYISQSTSKEIGRDTIQTVVRSVIACIILFSTLVILIIVLGLNSGSLPLFSGEYDNKDELGTALNLIVILGLSRVIEAVLRGALQGYRDFSFFYFSQIVSNLVKTGLCILALLAFSRSVVTFFEVQLLVSALFLLLLSVRLKFHFRFSILGAISLRSLTPLWPTASALSLNSALLVAATQFDRAVLAIYLEPARFSEYLTAILISSMVATIASPISQVSLPELQRAVTSGTESALRSSFRRSFGYSFAATTVLLLCLLTFGLPILSIFFAGTLDVEAVYSWVVPLSICFAMSSLVGVPGQLAIAVGRSGSIVSINFLNAAVSIGLGTWLISGYRELASILILYVTQLTSLIGIFYILPDFRKRLNDAAAEIKSFFPAGGFLVTSYLIVRVLLDQLTGVPPWFYLGSVGVIISLSVYLVQKRFKKAQRLPSA